MADLDYDTLQLLHGRVGSRERLVAEILSAQLENASDILRQLNKKLHVVEKAIADGSHKKSEEDKKLGAIETRIETNNAKPSANASTASTSRLSKSRCGSIVLNGEILLAS